MRSRACHPDQAQDQSENSTRNEKMDQRYDSGRNREVSDRQATGITSGNVRRQRERLAAPASRSASAARHSVRAVVPARLRSVSSLWRHAGRRSCLIWGTVPDREGTPALSNLEPQSHRRRRRAQCSAQVRRVCTITVDSGRWLVFPESETSPLPAAVLEGGCCLRGLARCIVDEPQQRVSPSRARRG